MPAKLKKIHSILKYIFIAITAIFTLPIILFMTGGFLSYFFNYNAIIEYQQALGIYTVKIGTIHLVGLMKELLFLILFLISIFFLRKKWFFNYIFILLITNYVINIITDAKKFILDEFFWIPFIYLVIYYLVDKKIKKITPTVNN